MIICRAHYNFTVTCFSEKGHNSRHKSSYWDEEDKEQIVCWDDVDLRPMVFLDAIKTLDAVTDEYVKSLERDAEWAKWQKQ